MRNKVRRKGRGYNERKREALTIFEESGGWLNPAAWAALARFYPVRASYSYLSRLHRWGLLERKTGASGLIVYGLSERGKERLLWLKERLLEER